jgi:methylenetetrahydrofolate--tRNA-(uracil-5-)-methyltransferase
MNEKVGKVLVIGAGLAGVEAAYFLASRSVEVILVESKTIKKNPAQKLDSFAELVCTNSLKSKNVSSAHGLLKLEMESFNSIVLESAKLAAVPAGDALAVDRGPFSKYITDKLHKNENITVLELEAINPLELKEKYSCDYVIVATGPLTTEPLATWIQTNISGDDFYFYDAIAPVVDADSLDYDKLYFKDRHKQECESADL